MLPIVKYPHAILRKLARETGAANDVLYALADEMYETMLAAGGIGLSAPQVGRDLRLIVIDVSEERNQRITLFNPEITAREGQSDSEEGCLSIPGIRAVITRAAKVWVSGINMYGEKQHLKAEGLLSFCLQHEIDHLNGVLFVDYLSQLKRERLLNKYHKLRETKENGKLAAR